MTTKTSTADLTERIAREFAKRLLEALGAKDLATVNARNATPEYATPCASHDFTDANEYMDEAFKAVGAPRRPAIWNAAWDLARDNGFWLTPEPVKRYKATRPDGATVKVSVPENQPEQTEVWLAINIDHPERRFARYGSVGLDPFLRKIAAQPNHNGCWLVHHALLPLTPEALTWAFMLDVNESHAQRNAREQRLGIRATRFQSEIHDGKIESPKVLS